MQDETLQDPYQAFRLPAYRRFLAGSLLMHVGTAMQGVAIGWEMYARTQSAFALGMVGLVQAIPMLLFTLPAGYLADVFDRRRLIQCGLIGSTATSLGLVWFSVIQGPVSVMYGLLFLDATFNRVAWPARTALLPQLVPAEIFENAVKWRTTLFQVSAMAGPALGGVVVAWSVPSAYFLCALSSVAFLILLQMIHVTPVPRNSPANPLEQLGEGLWYVWRQPILLGAISLDLFAVLLGGAVYLLPIYARDLIDLESIGLRPEQAFGWLRAAPAAGAVCMAFLLAHRPPMHRAGRNMFLAVAGFGVATILFGLSRNFWFSMAMLFLTGLFDNISVVVRQTLVQLRTPDAMRGRVSAVSAIFIGSSNELGGFESGLVARLFTPVISVVSGGIGTLVVVGLWARMFPSLRGLGNMMEEPHEAPVN